jgi:hypothetical protein
MENESIKISYDKIDPEEIIIKLKQIIAYLQKIKQGGRI